MAAAARLISRTLRAPKTIFLILSLCLTMFLTGCGLFGGGDRSPAPVVPIDYGEVRLQPAGEQVRVGDQVTVTLSLQGGRDLYGAAVRVTYPDTLLELTGVEWMAADDDVFAGKGYSWQHSGLEGEKGYVAVVRALSDPVTGTRPTRDAGDMVRLRWRARQAGEAQITLDRERLSIINSNGVEAAVEWVPRDARVTIVD